MAKYNYEYVDGKYQEIGEEEIDDIQKQQNTKSMNTNEFKSWVLPSQDQYKYVSSGNSYDVTNMVKSEFLNETQSLNSKYGDDLAVINTDFNTAKKDLDATREKELQEQYIQKEKKLDVLPANLAQTGLDGGANQTQSMKIETDYQSQRNEIESFFLNELNKLIQNRDEELRKEQEAYNKSMQSAIKSYESDLNTANTKTSTSTGSYVPNYNFGQNVKLPTLEDLTEPKKSSSYGSYAYDYIK